MLTIQLFKNIMKINYAILENLFSNNIFKLFKYRNQLITEKNLFITLLT